MLDFIHQPLHSGSPACSTLHGLLRLNCIEVALTAFLAVVTYRRFRLDHDPLPFFKPFLFIEKTKRDGKNPAHLPSLRYSGNTSGFYIAPTWLWAGFDKDENFFSRHHRPPQPPFGEYHHNSENSPIPTKISAKARRTQSPNRCFFTPASISS